VHGIDQEDNLILPHKILQVITGLPAKPFQQFNTGARSATQRQAKREAGNGKRETGSGK